MGVELTEAVNPINQQKMAKKEAKKRSTIKEVVTREYTVNLHKRIHRVGRKFKAPKAIKAIRDFALKEMGTQDVRIDPELNKQLWVNGSQKRPSTCPRSPRTKT